MITISAKLKDRALEPVLVGYAQLFARLERLLFVALYVKTESVAAAKRRFVAEHEITARQFNAVHNQLQARVEAWRAARERNVATTRSQIEKCALALTKIKRPLAQHHKQRRLALLTARLRRLETELAAKIPAICFGSRALFREQFNLEANAHASHAAWLEQWRAKRAAGFFVLGSSDETCGNQSCQYRDGQLHLRLPGALGGGTVAIPVVFAYRQADLLAALTPKVQRVQRGPRKGAEVERCDAVSYRFLRRDDRWYVYASFATATAPVLTDPRNGGVGVDLNPWGLAVTRIDRSGNIADHFEVPWQIEDRDQAQVQAAIGDAVRVVARYALAHGVPVAIERLDFAEAKKQGRGAAGNRMLSAFAYAAFARIMQGRCARDGIGLLPVNPAFTSVIGRGKFADGYGLSVHRAAAAVIARRALNFGEKLRTRSAGTARVLPARNRTRHVWHNWRLWAKARQPRRRLSTQPKGSRGLQPLIGRSLGFDPHSPNGSPCRADCATPNPGALTRGATPQASREHCSRGA
jgi:hypothetical protein